MEKRIDNDYNREGVGYRDGTGWPINGSNRDYIFRDIAKFEIECNMYRKSSSANFKKNYKLNSNGTTTTHIISSKKCYNELNVL